MTSTFVVGGNGQSRVTVNLPMANRHGLIAGATGTGKTVTLQVLAENFSRAGVPVLLADIKGDLSGLAKAAVTNGKIEERVSLIGLEHYRTRAYPCVFWDVYAKNGHALRTTLTEFGPLLLSEFLELNETQTAVIYAAFAIADEQGLLLLDIKDLQALLGFIKEERKNLEEKYGGISEASVAAIQRRLMLLSQQGGETFFGEPALNLQHLMQISLDGTGTINILDATQLIQQPRLYALIVLWLIAELFENLPERGDADKPAFVIFFDEAHLLFDNASKVLLDKIEQVVRLIRSKGVGIYFVTQQPTDIPENILGQLGHRVQHALRAFTPKDQKSVKVSASTFRPNPNFSTEDIITTLGTGEALVSVLDMKGAPTAVERITVCPPESQIGPINELERQTVMSRSSFGVLYSQTVDRESAYEVLKRRLSEQLDIRQKQDEQETIEKSRIEQEKLEAKLRKEQDRVTKTVTKSASKKDSPLEAFTKSTLRSVGSNLGRQIVRGILGALTGKK
jgi:DNA helicase HerA-like ATPase